MRLSRNTMPNFQFSVVVRVSGCTFDNKVVDGVITGKVFVQGPSSATIDGVPAALSINPDGTFMITVPAVLTNGVHEVVLSTSTDDCIASLLVFDDLRIVVSEYTCEALVPCFKDQSAQVIGVIIGFMMYFNDLTSPCDCIKLFNVLPKNIGVVYAYALKVMEFFDIKQFNTRTSFDEDIICLDIKRDMLGVVYCHIIDILNFPKTRDVVLQFQEADKIDLSKLVSNHENGFKYEIICKNVVGKVKLEGHVLHYTSPALSIFSIHLEEEIVYKVTNLKGKVNFGKIIIRAVV